MAIYFITFFISMFFCLFSEKSKNKGKNKTFILFSILSIIVPCILACERAQGIGTDTKVYIFPQFEKAKLFKNFFDYFKNSDTELLYSLLNFTVCKIFNNIKVLLFVYQLIIISFVYSACYYFDEKNFFLGYATFLLLFFNKSLNMCRQTIAISIILFATTKYLFNKKYLKYCILVLLAIGFHNSSVIALAILFIFLIINDKSKLTIVKKIILISLLLIMIAFSNNIIKALVSYNIIPEKYLYYINLNKTTVLPIEILFNLFAIIFSLVQYKYLRKKNNYSTIYFFWIIGIILYLIGFLYNNAQRASYYFLYFNALAIGELNNIVINKKQKIITTVAIVLILIIYSNFYYGHFLYDETVPYVLNFMS